MAAPMISGLRLALAAVLTLTLTLTGVGRSGAADLGPADAPYAIAGVAAPICHAGAGLPTGPVDPARPSGHDCCDACALLAPAVLPAAPFPTRPAPDERPVPHARAAGWVAALARPRSPWQSRAPPLA